MPDVVYSAQVGVSGGNPVLQQQITNSDFDPRIETVEGRASGLPNMATTIISSTTVAAEYVQSADPEAQLTTMDIAGFLTNFGTLGTLIADGSTVQIPYQKRANGTSFAGGSSNFLVRGLSTTDTGNVTSTACPAMLIPMQISAPRVGPVTANGTIHFLSGDGQSWPFTSLVNQALVTQAFNAMFGLGPVKINGSVVPYVVGVNLNFGLQFSEKQHFDGLPFPTAMYLEMVKPMFEIQVEDFSTISAFEGLTQLSQFSTFLRQRCPGSTFFADSTNNHIKLSVANGTVKAKALRASETKHGNAALEISGVSLTAAINQMVA